METECTLILLSLRSSEEGNRVCAHNAHVHCCAPTVGEGQQALLLSVRLSVCPSVAYIANNSRTERPSIPKFGRKDVPNLRCDVHTSFKVKRSKVRVSRPISADTHRAPYLPIGKAYELQTWYTDGGQRPASATGQSSKS